MAEQSQYQKRKQVNDLVKTLDRGQKGMLFETLLDEWAESLPKKGKEYGVSGGSSKYAERLDWLQEHWGTAFETKGTNAVRRMPLSGVIELLALFCLGAADQQKAGDGFGILEDGSELAERVASGLSAMRDANGPQVVISQSAYNELQKIRREYEELGGQGPETSTKILEKLMNQLQAMPGMKNEKEIAKYETTKTRKVKKEELPAGFTN
jgi:hypothetical protein